MMKNQNVYFHFRHIQIVIFAVCLFKISDVLAQWGELDEGQKCGSSFSDNGICKKVTDCPSAISALSRRRQHGLNRCGFDGSVEVVCCPTSEVREPEEDGGRRTTKKPISVWGESEKTTRKPFRTSTIDTRVDFKENTKRKSELACDEFSNEVPAEVEFQILGGSDATLTEFPHMAALGYRDTEDEDNIVWRCGGSVISNQYILTAAHCIINAAGAEPVKVRVGKVNISDNSSVYDYDVVKTIPHPKYVIRTKENDIALLKLSNRVSINKFVHPACLYNKNDDPSPLIVTGWGYTKPGQNASTILQKVTLNAVPVHECNTTYMRRTQRQITTKQICAGSDDGKKDACVGDSGGPLQIQAKMSSNIFSVVGITSYGTGCGGTIPAVYTRVSSYLDWIEDIVWS